MDHSINTRIENKMGLKRRKISDEVVNRFLADTEGSLPERARRYGFSLGTAQRLRAERVLAPPPKTRTRPASRHYHASFE